MNIHNKLVRDRIPEIIAKSGRKAAIRTLMKDEYLAALEKKLMEEANEYLASPCMEELADMLEVMEAICNARGYDIKQLLEIKAQKKKERGGFEKRVFLEYVD